MATTSFINALTVYFGPYWYVFAILMLVFGVGAFVLYMDRSDTKRYSAGMTPIAKSCYKNHTTFCRLVDKAGTEVTFESVTDVEHPGLVENGHTLVNPSLVSVKQRGRLTNGIPTLNYVLPYPFPMGFTSSLAIVQLVKKIREDFPELSFIADDLRIISLAFCSDKYLVANCRTAIETSLKMGADLPSEFLFCDEEDADEDELGLYVGDDDE